MSRYGEDGETGYDKEDMFYEIQIFIEHHGVETLLRIVADAIEEGK